MTTQPLVVIGVGPLGHGVARDLVETARALDAAAPVRQLAWHGGPRAEALLLRALEPALSDLLEAGSGRSGLDVLVVAHAGQAPPEDPARVFDVVSRHLADAWGVLFPADAPPDQRAAWGIALLATPPLRGPEAPAAFQTLAALQTHRQQAPHPTLARALVVPGQTTAGRLSHEALEQSLRATAQALYLSGLRGADGVRDLLAHRGDERFVTGLSVAAAELPVARLRRYARWRLALDGLEALVSRAEKPTGDPARAEALVARLATEELLEPFEEGEAAQRVRRHAASLSGAADRLPEELDIKLVERDHDLRARFRVLLGPATKPPPDRATEHPEHAEILRVLDRDEAFALAELDRRVGHLLAQELEPSTALAVLPHLERALVRAAHDLEESLEEDPDPLPALDPPAPPSDPGREVLQLAVEGRPRLGTVLPLALVLGAVAGIGVGLGAGAILAPEAAGAAVDATGGMTFSSGPTGAAGSDGYAWLAPAAGGVTGLIVSAAWTVVVLVAGRIALKDALISRRLELEGLWSRGGGGQPGRQAAALLAVRRRRVSAGLASRLRSACHRLAATRAALRRARDHARRELERLRVRLAAEARQDGLDDVLGAETPLHRPLLPPDEIADRLARTRPVQEGARMAQSLLAATWPREGLLYDLPAADLESLGSAADSMLPDLGPEALLLGPDVGPRVERRLARFVQGLPAGLAPGLDPRDEHGDPVRTAAPWLVLGPTALRGAVRAALQDRDVTEHWSDAPVPWVVAIASWRDLDLPSVRRGAGLPDTPDPGAHP